MALTKILSCVLLTASSAYAQGSREQMWPAPTKEDWQKPCLITWQRSYEDAVAESLATGKPILVCVNMDGEIASEHYAGIRYRQPEITALYEPYVTVIASVYRHTPRDYDEQGRRILCPRFGSVTCGEHIAIEPGLFKKFMDQQRVAPRHIGVQPGNEESFDIYYAFDTDSVFETIRDGVTEHPAEESPKLRADRSILDRVASRNSIDQTTVENAYLSGNREERRALLEAALSAGPDVPVDMLRLAVFGLDSELGRLARTVLAKSDSPGAIDLILEALRVPMTGDERSALIGALDRIGETSSRARTLAVVHRGLATRPGIVDVDAWSRELATSAASAAPEDAADWPAEILQSQNKILSGSDANAHVELAEALLFQAAETSPMSISRKAAEEEARLLYLDAFSAALRAETLGAVGWRVHAAIGTAALYLGRTDEAYSRAEKSVADIPPGATGETSFAMLQLFAKTRWRMIARAMRTSKEWSPEALADVHGAFTVLGLHPLCGDSVMVLHYDILNWLGAPGEAGRVLDEAMARFPESWDLHDRFRTRVLREKGRAGLELAYSELLIRPDASPRLEWFAGYASLVAAEYCRRAGNTLEAYAAYDRAIAYYERCIENHPLTQSSSDHYVALAIAGKARLAFENGDFDAALAGILASFERKEEAAATLDGMGHSPVSTAQMLLTRLTEEEFLDQASLLKSALDGLDPELLRLPAFERQGPRRQPPRGGQGRRRPG